MIVEALFALVVDVAQGLPGPVERRVRIAYLLTANAEGKPSGTRCVPYMAYMGFMG